MSVAPASAAETNRCPQCGAAFHCGVVAGEAQCWCASLPPVSLPPAKAEPGESAGANCLCPACLKVKLPAGDSAAHC